MVALPKAMPINALAKILIWSKRLTPDTVETMTAAANTYHYPLLDYIAHHRIADTQAIAADCARYFGVDLVDINTQHPDTLTPIAGQAMMTNDHCLLLADPDAFCLFKNTPKQRFAFVEITALQQLLSETTRSDNVTPTDTQSVRQLHQLLCNAMQQRASDIHFEPQKIGYRIRYRIDGLLQVQHALPPAEAAALVNQLKILADCDITEKRLPQDGRFQFTAHGHLTRDCRLSSCPSLFGEKIVLRLLMPNQKILQLQELGLDQTQQQWVMEALQKPQGLLLVTGPTGSGKTQTLYTLLNLLNNTTRNIVTIEEPIEIDIAGVNQTAVQHAVGLDYATVLRSFLRQDPDVIMIGEIRDLETATIAIRAAHTGHLVLATLHTNNSLESILRLRNLGIPLHDLSSTLTLIIAQRLVRCSPPHSGRMGVFEVLPITAAFRHCLNHTADITALQQAAKAIPITTLWESGLKKVGQQLTTQAEIQRVLPPDVEYTDAS